MSIVSASSRAVLDLLRSPFVFIALILPLVVGCVTSPIAAAWVLSIDGVFVVPLIGAWSLLTLISGLLNLADDPRRPERELIEAGLCVRCKYDLTAFGDGAATCPECGTARSPLSSAQKDPDDPPGS